jgi:anaerobic magnesium-protoporphyrin IX monomethyl ester cyclase
MILLLNPPNPPGTVSNKDMMGGFGQLYPAGVQVKIPPLDLVYSAAILKTSNIDFEVIDCLGLELDLNLLKEKISAKNYEYVFIRTSTASFSFDLETAGLLKKNGPCKTVFFGPHTGVFPEEVLKSPLVDAIIIGEPENTVMNVAASGFKDVKGIWYKNNSSIVKNEASSNMVQLDSLPFPAWEYFPYEKYNIGDLLKGQGNTSFVLTSRGCPFNCDYCPYPVAQGTIYRKRTSSNVIEEIKYLHEKFKVEKILFRDAEFTLDRKKVLEICDGIKDLKLKWRCETRIDTLDIALVAEMAEAGCVGINMGIESGSERVIKASGRKMINKIYTEEILGTCRELGINTFCFFIVGLPGDDLSSIVETMEFAEKINADISQFTVATPYPGTRLHDWAQEKQYMVNYNDDKITGYEALMRNENLTVSQIMGLRNAIQERIDSLKEIRKRNCRELVKKRMLVTMLLWFFVSKAKKKIVIYGVEGVDFRRLEATGCEIVGVVDEKYFGEKIGNFTVLPPVIIPVLRPDVVIVSHLKRSVNIRQYTGEIKIIEPLALFIKTGKKIKGLLKRKAAII